MVAYSFKARFVAPILAGTKGGTIRLPRKPGRARIKIVLDEGQLYARERPGGHVRVGEEMQLYTGMRTKHCLLIARKTCVAVEPIRLNFRVYRCWLGDVHHLRVIKADFERFARFDGFESLKEMAEFWKGRHVEPWWLFDGWHIRWLPLPWERA